MSLPSKILCPVDLSPCSAHALGAALDLAEQLGAHVSVLHAFHVPHYIQPSLMVWLSAGPRPVWEVAQEQASLELDAFLSRVVERPRQIASHEVIHGDPTATILTVAERDGHDLIVMGTHGRTGAKRVFLGSVAEGVVRRAACPVLTVPDPPQVSRLEHAAPRVTALGAR